jgi:hypothetical protein
MSVEEVRINDRCDLHLPSDFKLSDLGFPEFESIHLTDFSIKAQFSKSAASTIPPRPHNLIEYSDICLFHH